MNLHHPHTPDKLVPINDELSDCLASDPVDESHLQLLVEQRAKLVDILLKEMSKAQREQFAKAEMSVNEDLISQVTALRNVAKKALGSVAKSSRAIKQYQKV